MRMKMQNGEVLVRHCWALWVLEMSLGFSKPWVTLKPPRKPESRVDLCAWDLESHMAMKEISITRGTKMMRLYKKAKAEHTH